MPRPPQAVEVSCSGDAKGKTKLNVRQNNITKEAKDRVITSG